MDLEKEIESGKTKIFTCNPKRASRAGMSNVPRSYQYNYSIFAITKTIENGTSQKMEIDGNHEHGTEEDGGVDR